MVGGKFIQVLLTVVLARILVPEDFGIIGLLAIFMELAKVLLDSGFSQALIRKQDVGQRDFTSVFYFNIFVGAVLYLILYFTAPFISDFYDFPDLTTVSRVVFLTVIINSFGIVQNAKVVQAVNFKILANRTIIANLLSGIIAVYLAILGFGVWALVWQMVIAAFFRVVLLWFFSKWKPSFELDFGPVKKLLPFSSNLLLSGLFDVVASNIQTLLIGKFYTKSDLGFYTQAKIVSGIPSQTLTSIIRNVTYPTLSVLQDDNIQLKRAYRKVITVAMFAVFPTMLGLMSLGPNLIPLVLGEKWTPSISYFMILCMVGAIYPLYSINQNIFLVRGEGKLFLKVSLIKRIISIIIILITIKISIMALVLGHLLATTLNTLITMYYSGIIIGYGLKEQIKDFFGLVSLSIIMSLFIYFLNTFFHLNTVFGNILIQTIFGFSFFISISYFFKLKGFNDVIDILRSLLIKS